MAKFLAAAIFASIAFGNQAFAQDRPPAMSQVPNETDLKAGFCLGYWKGTNPIDVSAFPPEMKEQLESTNRQVFDARRRLAAYLLPRFNFLDPTSMTIAMQAGEGYHQTLTAVMPTCVQKQTDECKIVFQKVADCRIASFLPF